MSYLYLARLAMGAKVLEQLRDFSKQLSPMRWSLIVLFFILVISEFSNGLFDIGNIIAPILLALLINQYYLIYRNGKGRESAGPPPVFHAQNGRVKRFFAFIAFIFRSIKSEILAEGESRSPKERAIKILMNNLFVFMFIMAIFGGVFSGLNQDLKLFAIFVWSLAFLGLNVREFIRTLSYARLLMANLGLLFVLGSVTMIII